MQNLVSYKTMNEYDFVDCSARPELVEGFER